MGKSWSSPSITAAIMMNNRASLVNKLMHYSRKIDHRKDNFQETAEFLARCASELAMQTAACFIKKCARLETEFQNIKVSPVPKGKRH
ncbi:hypothetical protein N7448_001509 [Penicillium atrosanguineum]|uniref:Uncharacterized protein n=1 Tax=Penicillium atrosanguineum TaxID=1132637 RepID=A0A9W9HMH1_9EURO|nr:uncharacterized protein N7443_004907 [Penicillium atrosanguineum]KAJ5133463.1 hypothetical protein N7526_004828 [Penicillium atrosanguineum]KAJ5149931.1 hypothetical protein N7448_001509 [Penicillium atrosanguineum]KAJ5305247.1 hypothetical protein N7443_004907 [Penicillium atrosanguineum]KAJ5324711.1 hypothetical protein N7476_003311 [Penicillium atrosanguineum]